MHPVPSDTTGVLEKKVLVGFNMQLAALLDSIRNEDQTLRLKSRDLEKAGADPGNEENCGEPSDRRTPPT